MKHGSVNPALQKMAGKDWLTAEWRKAENNRRPRQLEHFNLYNRDNPRGWSSSLETDEGGLVRMDSGPVSNLPRLPSLGIAWNF